MATDAGGSPLSGVLPPSGTPKRLKMSPLPLLWQSFEILIWPPSSMGLHEHHARVTTKWRRVGPQSRAGTHQATRRAVGAECTDCGGGCIVSTLRQDDQREQMKHKSNSRAMGCPDVLGGVAAIGARARAHRAGRRMHISERSSDLATDISEMEEQRGAPVRLTR